MNDIQANNKHFTEQWGKRFRSFDNFLDRNFVHHLLSCTNTEREDWENKRVFEGGAGCGRNTLAALQLGVSAITATDVSAGGVDAMRENLKDFTSADIYQCSLTDLHEESDNYYEVVFSVNCLPHIKDYRKALSELVRVCKPGGLVLFNVPPVRPKLVAEVDNKIREYSTKMCPDCGMLFSQIIVYFAHHPEIAPALAGKMELSGDLLSSFDHFLLPLTQEFTVPQITKDCEELGIEILKIDERISVKGRKK